MLTLITGFSLGTFFTSYFLYNVLDFFNLKRWFLDKPDQLRKTQKEAVPRYGGIVIAFTCLTALLVFPFFESYRIVGILGFIIFLIGVLDDLVTLPWTLKSIIQFTMGIYLASIYITPLETVHAFGYTFFNKGYFFECLFLIWFLGLTNSINLIDGLDGLAGGLSAILCLPLLLIGIQAQILPLVVLMTIVLSSIVVFLVYNSKPARLYMGDSGSLFLGYIFSLVPIFFIEKTSDVFSVDISHILVLYAYIITDTLRVMVARFKLKKHPMTPDRGHLHHLLLDSTSSYNGTLFLIFSIGSFLSLVVLNAAKLIQTQAFALVFYPLFLMFIFSVQTRMLFIKLCTKLVISFRDFFYSRACKGRRYARGIIFLSLSLNLLYGIYVMMMSDVSFAMEITLMATFGFLILLFGFYRQSLLVFLSFPITVALLLFSMTNFHDYFGGFGVLAVFNLVSCFCLSGLATQKLLLRYWNIYDLVLIFFTGIVIFSHWNLMTWLQAVYMVSFYLVLKVSLSQIEGHLKSV